MGCPILHSEYVELQKLLLSKKALLAGRTLWLGGTEISRKRESSQFNCSFLKVAKVPDFVDAMWLLLQGCGVGFKAVDGSVHGFASYIPEILVTRSERQTTGGYEYNKEVYDASKRLWTIKVGDSAEAWAKLIGILLSRKYRNVRKLVLDFSEIRPAGQVLKGYGWISSGDNQISIAYPLICKILNDAWGRPLRRQEIRDILNLMGTILSSRRSAEISLEDAEALEAHEFADCKRKGFSSSVQWFRCQSNNSLVFNKKPSELDLERFFLYVLSSEGGAEPGLMNMEEARRRAAYCSGTNPCGEILLPDMGFCNLVEINLNAFDSFEELKEAAKIIARANYRQSCVNLEDEILQHGWHENNQALHLCGVSVTGIVQSSITDEEIADLRQHVHDAVDELAAEANLPNARLVTCVKPSGTLSKVMGCSEGIHRPISKYILNYIQFSKHSPLVPLLIASGFAEKAHPFDKDSVLIGFPISWEEVEFKDLLVTKDGSYYLDNESAVDQLNRYMRWNKLWSDHNSSITVTYLDDEIPSIIKWLSANWESVVGISFMRRVSAMATPEHGYNPQQAISKETYEELSKAIRPVPELSKLLNGSIHQLLLHEPGLLETPESDCVGGACPVR